MLERISAHSTLIRLVVFGVILVVLASYLRYTRVTSFIQGELTELVEQQELSLAQYIARDIDFKLVRREAYLKSLALDLSPAILAHEETRRDWLRHTLEFQTMFSAGMQFLDAQGRPLSRETRTTLDPEAPLDPDARKALAAGQVWVARPVLDRNARPVLPLIAPLRAADGQLYAAVAGLTYIDDPAFLDNLVQHPFSHAPSGILVISPRDHLFIAASQPEFMLRPTPATGINPLHDRAMAGYRGAGVTVNAAGIEEISAIASVPSTGWFVVARRPTSEAYAIVDHTKSFMLRGSLVALLSFVLVFLAIVHLVLRPLVKATRMAERMTRGDAPLRPLTGFGDDEVGRLVSAFNRLLDKLNTQNNLLALAAHHDGLTGLPNRTLLADRLAQALAHAARHQNGVAVLYLDLDEFKPVNDQYGHEVGDRVLQEVATRLTHQVRGTDSVARIGGDEFVVLISDLRLPAEAVVGEVARQIIALLSAPIEVGELRCRVGVSVGCAIGDHTATAQGLLLQADHLMYQAKAQGRGRYVLGGAMAARAPAA